MKLRVLVIGGIFYAEELDILNKVLNTYDIQISFMHYLTDTKTKNGKELTKAILDKYDVWVFKKAPSPIQLRNMLDEVEYEKDIFVPIYKEDKLVDFQKVEDD